MKKESGVQRTLLHFPSTASSSPPSPPSILAELSVALYFPPLPEKNLKNLPLGLDLTTTLTESDL